MDYYSKYLKYKNKYISLRNNINKGGASFPNEDPAFRHAIEESMKSTEEDDIVRQVLKETRDTNFMERARKAKILVIGATIDRFQSDIDRWSQIDPNFIGISHMGDDPISDLGSWNDNENYWIDAFNILENRTFDSIYIDRGTIHHMSTNTGKVIGTAYGRLIKFIHERNITNKLYIYDDSISTTTIKPDILNGIYYSDKAYAVDLQTAYTTEEARVRSKGELSRYLMKYFKCCDTPTYINWSVNGQIIPELFVAWTRRE
jgi:hypothetical protein